MGAITACRTAALGGHVEQCDDCGNMRIAYNSCRNRHSRSARGWRAPNGSRIDRPNCCRCPTSASSSSCRRWRARSPSRTRLPSMRSCSAPPPPLGHSPPWPPIAGIWARKSASPQCSIPGVRACSTIRTFIAWCRAAALVRRHELDRLPPRLLPAGARALAPVSQTVPAEPAGCIRRRRAALLRQPCRSCRAHSLRPGLDQLRRIEWVVYAKPPVAPNRYWPISAAIPTASPSPTAGWSRSPTAGPLRLEGLSPGQQDQGDDARCRRVHPPFPVTCPAGRLPSHSLLRLSCQCHRARPGIATRFVIGFCCSSTFTGYPTRASASAGSMTRISNTSPARNSSSMPSRTSGAI
jgi:hypothetical protein